VRTPSGGLHLWFQVPPKIDFRSSVGALVPGIDIRANGSYVVTPPSYGDYEKGGNRITGPWVWENDDEPALLPDEWRKAILALKTNKPKSKVDGEAQDTIPEFTRNVTLTSLAGSMRRRGMSQGAIEAALLVENRERCRPPLDDKEVQRIAASVSKYEPGQRTSAEHDPRNADNEGFEWPEDDPSHTSSHIPEDDEETYDDPNVTDDKKAKASARRAAFKGETEASALKRIRKQWPNLDNPETIVQKAYAWYAKNSTPTRMVKIGYLWKKITTLTNLNERYALLTVPNNAAVIILREDAMPIGDPCITASGMIL
jgi:hypothetical protein